MGKFTVKNGDTDTNYPLTNCLGLLSLHSETHTKNCVLLTEPVPYKICGWKNYETYYYSLMNMHQFSIFFVSTVKGVIYSYTHR